MWESTETTEDRMLCHGTAQLRGDWNIIVLDMVQLWWWHFSVIFLSSMCPLLPGQVICHSDLPTFSSSVCFCKVNWQTAFPLYRSFCLLLAAHLLTSYLWLYCIWLQAYSLLLIYGFTVARLQFKLHVTNYCLLLSGTSRKRVTLS